MKVYLDNTATSWPKPYSVVNAISDYLVNYGANPGKSGHGMSLKAGREVFEARELIAEFFNVEQSEKVIYTANATQSLNTAIQGLIKEGDHVIISSLEHNCVIRPLRELEKSKNIELSIIQCDNTGIIDISKIENAIKRNTKAVITLHGSNVTGSILPIREIGSICKENNIIYIVDASQTVGYLPVDMNADNIDILAFTGHKKLYGPPGIGVLCLNNDIDLPSMIQGGTGSFSEHETMPDFYPDKLEAGTKNSVGIIGLKAGMQFVIDKGIYNIRKQLNELTYHFIDRLEKIEGITVYGPDKDVERLPIVSVNIEGMSQSDIAYKLDTEFGIMVRAGLHCAPLAHKTIGTYPNGSVRFSMGCYNTKQEIDYAVDALIKIKNN